MCCEVTDNNELFIRLLGSLSRHRRLVRNTDNSTASSAPRKGVGRALLTKVIKDAEARHLHSVYTVVR